MTIEDEGIEPDFELDWGKTTGKRDAMKINSTSPHDDKSCSRGKGKLNNGSGKISNGDANGFILEAKRQLKRKLALESEQNGSHEEADVPKKKKKKKSAVESSAGSLQSATPVVTQKKKKKLLKKRLMEGVAVEEVAQTSLKELIRSKPTDPQNANADGATANIRPKKKKKEKKTADMPSEVAIPLKKPIQSSLEPPIVVADDGDVANEQDWKLFDPEKRKKKKVKKKIIAKEEEAEKQEDKKSMKTKKKKKMKKITDSATNAEEHIEGKKQDSAPNPQQNPAKYKELLERLSSIKKEGEARQMITAEVAAGKLEKSEIMTVLRMWRQQKRRKMQAENKDKLAQMDGTLEELKKTVNDLVRKGKLRGKDAGDIIRRWKMREKRRVERQVAKQTNRSCFHCRQQGHVLADCPNRGEGDQTVGNMATLHGDGICFKCGSTEHNVHKCPRKNVKGFPYATCFVCGQQGHLSRDCEKNANGIYPDGGGCNVCGSTKHLKRDCPELAAQKQKKDERSEWTALGFEARSGCPYPLFSKLRGKID
ncbi:hypothetical protein Y032_0069g352 [Ancylostoma ceylanicum]|uniref:CCHC-type domain-containing protein n=1 Tax=Ancylostoma ceylanicum TaxID=53326 RepID=A0A016TXC9_9BILA|nr:hypothetical protein Y032_0069g352 [Ancylostoma ceylanicum]